MRVYDADATSGPAANCSRSAHILRWLRCVASWICLPSCCAGHSGPGIPWHTALSPAHCATASFKGRCSGPWPSSGSPQTAALACITMALRAWARQARPGTCPARHSRSSRPAAAPSPPGPAQAAAALPPGAPVPAPSRRARGPPTAKSTLPAGEGQGGGRQLRVASSARRPGALWLRGRD